MDAGNVAQKLKIMDLIKIAEQAFATEVKNFPVFKAGDTITITYRIKEENKERLQKFRGVCIQRKGTGVTQTFTVRKISNGIGVERIFPLTSPFIENIELNKVGKVRRARIFYLRKLTGKKARIKEKKMALIVEEHTAQE
jgi:large subunit ribosomal protein L19